MIRSGICIVLVAAGAALGQQSGAPQLREELDSGVAVFVGGPVTGGAIRVFDELDGSLVEAPAELRDVRLLPIDVNGRSRLDALRTDRPQLRDDVPGASRLELPGRLGSLYRYERTGLQGEVRFGFLRVSPRGRPLRILERDGTGPLAADDPFVSLVAAAPASEAILVATRIEAGGDLFELDLVTGDELLRTPHLPPLEFYPRSLALLDGFGAAASARAVHRFPRTPDGVTSVVTEVDGTAPPWLSGEVVVSRNGAWAATAAGSAVDLARVHVFGANGPFRCPEAQATPLLGAGFLPEAPSGPWMAVSDDGETVAWTCTALTDRGTLGMECFVASLPPRSAAPAEHVTRDEVFPDTLDEVGVVGFVAPDRLVLGVGEAQDPPLTGLERFELFTVTVGESGPLTAALTHANGDIAPPFFDDPDLKPEENTFWVPEGEGFLIYDGERDRIVAARVGSPGITVLLEQVKDFAFVRSVGEDVVVAVRRNGGSQPWELHRISKGLSQQASVVALGTSATDYTTPIANEVTREFVFVTAINGVDVLLSRVDLDTGLVQSLIPVQPPYGPTLSIAPNGGIAFSAGKQYGVWPPGARAPVLLQIPRVPGFILPGR